MVVSYVSNVPSIFKALFEMIKECTFWNMGERDMFYFRGERNNFKDPGAASLSDVGALAHGELDSGKFDSVASAIAAGAKEAGVKQSSSDIIASLQENV